MPDRIADIAHLPSRVLATMFYGASKERDMWRDYCLEAENMAGRALGLMLEAAREMHGSDGDTDLIEKMRKEFPHFFEINTL